MNWDIELARVMIFTDDQTHDAADLWHKVTGAFPDSMSRRGLPPPQLSIASGLYKDLNVVIAVQIGRIEMAIGPVDNSNGSKPPPMIASRDADAFIKTARELSGTLVALVPGIRFAVHSQLAKETRSEADGVELLNGFLGNVFPKNADSVNFQFNIREPHERHELSLNRLCKWGVVQMVFFGLSVDGSNRISSQGTAPSYRAFLHLDINNPGSKNPLSPEEAKELLARLWEQESAIRARGRDAL